MTQLNKSFPKYVKNLAVIGFFSILLFVGLKNYKDYGVGVDEPVERMNGAVSLNYLADLFQISSLQKNVNLSIFRELELSTYKDRDYPVAFNLPAVFLEQLLGIEDQQQIYFFRHLLNYLICLFGVYALYRLAQRRYQNWRIGLLAATFFVLSPRLFPEFFYNSKDLIFLTFFVLGTNTLVKYSLNPSRLNSLLHAAMTALAINIRIMGVLLVVVTIAIILIKLFKAQRDKGSIFSSLVIYLCIGFLLTVGMWPWLWSNPIENFIEGFRNMAHFRQEMPVWYMGIPNIFSNNIPWHYIPVWILVTTPLLYIVLFTVGAISSLFELIVSKFAFWRSDEELQDLIFMTLFFAPVILVITLNSVLYNAWRQLFFVYPFFLLISIRGLQSIWHLRLLTSFPHISRAVHVALIGVCLLSLSSTLGWMIKSHPLQNFYLNVLASKAWYEDFAGDYWGLLNRKTLEFIAQNDERPYVRVAGAFFLNPEAQLSIQDRAKIVRANSIEDADYLLNDIQNPQFQTVYKVMLDGQLLASASKRINDTLIIHPTFLNQTISFSKTSDRLKALTSVGQQPFTGAGWAYPEDWGVWLDGSHAQVLLPMPNPKPQAIDLTIRAFLSDKKLSQTVDVFINRVFAKRITINQPGDLVVELALNSKMLEFNYIQIEFIPKGPLLSPKELGMGEDGRKLSIGLRSLMFH